MQGSGEDNCSANTGGASTSLGLIAVVGGTLYSMIDAAMAADRYNAAQAKNSAFGWSPTWAPGPDGSARTGAMAWMRF